MKDVTRDLSRFQLQLTLQHGTQAILRGGLQDGHRFPRTHNPLTYKNSAYPEELHVRSGEVEMDEAGNYYVVYRLKTSK